MTDIEIILEIPFYCKECGKCKDYKTVNKKERGNYV